MFDAANTMHISKRWLQSALPARSPQRARAAAQYMQLHTTACQGASKLLLSNASMTVTHICYDRYSKLYITAAKKKERLIRLYSGSAAPFFFSLFFQR